MVNSNSIRQRPGVLATLAGACLLTGCAFLEPRLPDSSWRGGAGDAGCMAALSRAHVALAAAGRAAGDPVGISAAHADHAVAMHEYHMCLASRGP